MKFRTDVQHLHQIILLTF